MDIILKKKKITLSRFDFFSVSFYTGKSSVLVLRFCCFCEGLLDCVLESCRADLAGRLEDQCL